MPKNIICLLLVCLAPALAGADATAETITARYATAAEVPFTSSAFVATGKNMNVSLSFAPAKGKDLVLVRNTGTGFIQGKFNNLAHGQIVTLHFGQAAYHFVANYYGGSGKDLVLASIDLDDLSAAAKSKLDDILILALKKARGQAPFDRATSLRPEDYEKEGRVLVTIQTSTPDAVVTELGQVGAEVISGWTTATSVRALVPLTQLEALANLPDVQSVTATRPNITHRLSR